MNFLVTGGAGFIGSHIAEELKNRNLGEVLILDNLNTGSTENIPVGCKFLRADIRAESEVQRAMKGIDIVFHNAAYVSIRGSFQAMREELEANAIGTLNVLEAAAKSSVEKVVFASSMAVYGEPLRLPVNESDPCSPTSPYGLSKLRGELYGSSLALERGLKFVSLRYFNTYGLRQKPSPYVGVITTFIRQALEGKSLTVFGDGNQTRDFVWVKDIARANVLSALSEATGIFNVGSGVEMSINQIADLVIDVLGGRKVHQGNPPGEVTKIVADISRAQQVLGYHPEGRLERILPLIADSHRDSFQIPNTSH